MSTLSNFRHSHAWLKNAGVGREYFAPSTTRGDARIFPEGKLPRNFDETRMVKLKRKEILDESLAWQSRTAEAYRQKPFIAQAASDGITFLVGEGNLSFTRSLVEDHLVDPQLLIASTHESFSELSDEALENVNFLLASGVETLFDVDATNLAKHIGTLKFHNIVFQFPNAGSREPKYGHNPNYILLRKFLKDAKAHIDKTGRVLVSTVDNAYYDGRFRIDDAIKYAELETPVAVPFSPDDYPSYNHVNTVEGEESALSRYKKFSTWVFEDRL